MGSIRARQKGWRVARGSARQQRVLVLWGECPWHGAGGALPLSALLSIALWAWSGGSVMCFVCHLLFATWSSPAEGNCAVCFWQPLQSILCCSSGLASVRGNLRREATGPFARHIRRPMACLDQGELGRWPALAMPTAKTPLCSQSWLLSSKPPCWVVAGEGQGRTLPSRCRRARAARELLGQQRSSSQGKLQLTTSVLPPNSTVKSQLREVKLRPNSGSPVRAEPLRRLCPSLALYPEKGHVPVGSNFWGGKGAPWEKPTLPYGLNSMHWHPGPAAGLYCPAACPQGAPALPEMWGVLKSPSMAPKPHLLDITSSLTRRRVAGLCVVECSCRIAALVTVGPVVIRWPQGPVLVVSTGRDPYFRLVWEARWQVRRVKTSHVLRCTSRFPVCKQQDPLGGLHLSDYF